MSAIESTAIERIAPRTGLDAFPKLAPALLTLLIATSSIVYVEPAPYDLLAIVMSLGLMASGLRVPHAMQSGVLLLGLFIAANVLAALFASDPLQSIRSLAIRMYMPMTFLLVACLIAAQPYQMLAALWRGYVIAAVIAVIWGTLEFLGFLPGELWEGGLRAKGGFEDPNVFGPFLVPAAVHAVRRMAGGRRADVIVFLPLFMFFAFGVLISFSRGAWMSFMVSVGLFGLLSFIFAPGFRSRLQWLLGSVAVLAVIVGGLAASVSVDVLGKRFFQRAVITQQYDVATGGRFDIQIQALEQIGRDPIGVGPGRSGEEFGLVPHNLYLHVLVEAGWLGGLAFAAFLVLTGIRLLPFLFVATNPLRNEVFLIFACLTGQLFQSLFIDSTHWRHLWLLLALAWGLSIACKRTAPGS